MNRKILSDKLAELYNKEQYNHPIQSRPEPKAGITGEEPDQEDLGVEHRTDEEDNNIKKGNQSDLGKGSKKDIGRKKSSEPKDWNFQGPRDSIEQE